MNKPNPRHHVTRIRWVAAVSAVAGAVLSLAAIGFDWSGFWGGFALGAGIAAIVLAAYLWGLVTGMSRAGHTPTWLPARTNGSV